MAADPNWLLSTIVQSTAAIVAIVAGFIISRLLALSAERSGLKTRVQDLELQLEIKGQDLEDHEKRLLEWDAQDFLEIPDVLDVIVASEGKISLRDAIKRSKGYDRRTEDELRPYWEEAVKVTQTAYRFVRERFSELLEGLQHSDLDRLFPDKGLDLSHYQLKIYLLVFVRIQDEYERERNPLKMRFDFGDGIKIPLPINMDEINQYRILERDIETLERDKNALEIQKSDLTTRLKYMGRPNGVIPGIALLAYFGIVGIAFPVSLMPFPSDQFAPVLKSTIIFLFISGLLFFLFYLFWLIRQLAEESDS